MNVRIISSFSASPSSSTPRRHACIRGRNSGVCGEDVGSRMCVTRSFVDVVAQLLMAGMGVGGGVE